MLIDFGSLKKRTNMTGIIFCTLHDFYFTGTFFKVLLLITFKLKKIMAAVLDFSQARFKHLNWKFRLRSFLDGQETLTKEQAVSHKDCDLGKWMYGGGIEKYKQHKEMQDLEKVHETLHKTIKSIVELKGKGDKTGAETEYKKVESISGQIIGYLDALEKKVI